MFSLIVTLLRSILSCVSRLFLCFIVVWRDRCTEINILSDMPTRRVVIWDNKNQEDVVEDTTRRVLADYPDDEDDYVDNVDDDYMEEDEDVVKEQVVRRVPLHSKPKLRSVAAKKVVSSRVRRIPLNARFEPRTRLASKRAVYKEVIEDEGDDYIDDIIDDNLPIEDVYSDEEPLREVVRKENGMPVRYIYVKDSDNLPRRHQRGIATRVAPIRSRRSMSTMSSRIRRPGRGIKSRVTYTTVRPTEVRMESMMRKFRGGERNRNNGRVSKHYMDRSMDGGYGSRTRWTNVPRNKWNIEGMKVADRDERLERLVLNCNCNETGHKHKGRGFTSGRMRAFE